MIKRFLKLKEENAIPYAMDNDLAQLELSTREKNKVKQISELLSELDATTKYLQSDCLTECNISSVPIVFDILHKFGNDYPSLSKYLGPTSSIVDPVGDFDNYVFAYLHRPDWGMSAENLRK